MEVIFCIFLCLVGKKVLVNQKSLLSQQKTRPKLGNCLPFLKMEDIFRTCSLSTRNPVISFTLSRPHCHHHWLSPSVSFLIQSPYIVSLPLQSLPLPFSLKSMNMLMLNPPPLLQRIGYIPNHPHLSIRRLSPSISLFPSNV